MVEEAPDLIAPLGSTYSGRFPEILSLSPPLGPGYFTLWARRSISRSILQIEMYPLYLYRQHKGMGIWTRSFCSRSQIPATTSMSPISMTSDSLDLPSVTSRCYWRPSTSVVMPKASLLMKCSKRHSQCRGIPVLARPRQTTGESGVCCPAQARQAGLLFPR